MLELDLKHPRLRKLLKMKELFSLKMIFDDNLS
jgi:hypothetical protein